MLNIVSNSSDRLMADRPGKITILSVEDDRLEQVFLKKQILDLGHATIQASDGEEALKILADPAIDIDVILMDRLMPNLDGMAAIKEIKKNSKFKNIPVIMVSSATTPKDIKQGIDAGVFYYLNKPVEGGVLKSVLTAATQEVQRNKSLTSELKRHKDSFEFIEYSKFNFKTLGEAESLSAFLALCFSDVERAASGLSELLTNAIEHGNLEIGFDEKTRLVETGRWYKEILNRQAMHKYKDRSVTVTLKRQEDGVYVVITDEGNGFEWKNYLMIDPARASHTHGRGIVKAKSRCFDRLTYNEAGNQVIVFMASESSFKW